MIHSMTTATVRDLRTKFPKLKAIIAREGELVVTDRGRPAYLLLAFTPPRTAKPPSINYFARLKVHQPHPLSVAASRALDEHDRGER
jgi:antitoxin (DNA-binding transcriptional repressor) of toxin-antitoxin stability system